MYKFAISYLDRDGQEKTYITYSEDEKEANQNFLKSSWSKDHMSVVEIKKVKRFD